MESLWEGLLYSHDEIKHQGAIGRTCWSPQKMILKPPSPNVFGKKSCFFPVCWVFSVSQTERGLSESSWRMLWWANEQLGWLFAPTWCGNKQSNWGIGALALARYGYLNFPQKNTWKGYISWCRLVARFQYCLKKAPAATCVLWVELQNRPGVFSPPPPPKNQVVVIWWFLLVVCIPGIPYLLKGIVTWGIPLDSQTTGLHTTNLPFLEKRWIKGPMGHKSHISISPRFMRPDVDRPSDTKPSTHVTPWYDEQPTVTFMFPPKQAWKHQHQSMVLLLGFELLLMVQKSHSQPLGMVLKPCK